MAFCHICGNYDSEHTDGEPSMMIGKHYKPLLDYFYSVEMLGEDWCDYNWGHLKNSEGDEVSCLCQLCFNSLYRMFKIKWNCK